MTHVRQLWTTAVAIVLVATISGCARDRTADPGFAGHWHSPQWGEHYVLVEGDTVRIVYDHLDGRVVGTLHGPVVSGWWTEAPSRQPSGAAGVVEFTLTGTGADRRVHGVWRHGQDGADREDWDLVWVDATIPADVRARFDDATSFVPAP